MRSSRLRRVAPCAALCLALPATWALPAHYHLTDLGPASQVEAMSPGGRIAGQDAHDGHAEAAVWIGAKAHDLPNPFSTADAHGISDGGMAVGEIDGGNFRHAAAWLYGQLTDLGAMAGTSISVATAVNALGACTIDVQTRSHQLSYVVPGCADTGAGVRIHSLGGTGTVTTAIDDSGQVVGAADPPNSLPHAFLYAHGITHDLGLLDGDNESEARAINDIGHVAGNSDNYPFLFRAFFHDGQAMHALGTFGGAHTHANAINHDDLVVGTADLDPVGQDFHAFVVDAAGDPGTLHDLNDMLDRSGSGWSLKEAVGIDAAGRIIVHGLAPGDTTPRSALLTPLD